MIIVSLGGGLGNQMFQYALGRKLSIKNNTVLKLDISAYQNGFPRPYDLGHFNIIENIATPEEIHKTNYPHGIFSILYKKIKLRVFKVRNVQYKPHILRKKSGYFGGFWQSEKYFSDIADTLRKDFSLKEKLGARALEIEGEILKTENPVSLHIRRGDYVTDKYFQVCSKDYYEQALEIIKEKTKNPTLFVFSDDIPWVKENMNLPSSTIFASSPVSEEIKNYEEITLMSKCHHHIISNSTFGWWGAWLNPNQNKVVVAPEKWFNTHKSVYKNLVPDSWIKI